MIELLINNFKKKNTDRLSVHCLHRLNFIKMNSEENMFWGGILVYIRKKIREHTYLMSVVGSVV